MYLNLGKTRSPTQVRGLEAEGESQNSLDKFQVNVDGIWLVYGPSGVQTLPGGRNYVPCQKLDTPHDC